MKKGLFIFLLLTIGLAQDISAQLCISTEHRIDAYWSDSKETWIETSGADDNTLFKFNEAMTMFDHTTATIKSTYYIIKIEEDEEDGSYNGEVRSDVGNKYTFSIDTENKNINFMYDRDGTTYLVRHKIKQAFECKD